MSIDTDSQVNRDLDHRNRLVSLRNDAERIGAYYFRTPPITINVQNLIRDVPVLNDFYLACYDSAIINDQQLNDLVIIVSGLGAYAVALRDGRLVKDESFFSTLRTMVELSCLSLTK